MDRNLETQDEVVDNEKVESKVVGLTEEEVQERIKKGQVNILPKAPSRTIGQIIKANLFTLFNAINAVLAVIVITAGSPKNALFAGVILSNTLLGIIQQLRAKATLEKLSVLNMSNVKVIRDGEAKEIYIEELVLDDVMILTPGDQVVADGVVLKDSEFEVDESLLTGEADSVGKKENTNLLSGSFIVAGEGYAKVINVGANTYTAKLADEARKFKLINSELQGATNKILKIIMWLIIPIGGLLVTTQILFSERSWQEAVIGTTAGIIGMVPEGMVLLTSLTFVVGVVRLSKWKTLVQELPATEILARVDVLCLDKTGTLTEGALKLIDVVVLGKRDKKDIDDILSAIVHAFPHTNPTQHAILERYSTSSNLNILKKVPFSSARKWSGITIEDKGNWVLGAPEMILGDAYEDIREQVEKEAVKGRRVLLLANFNGEELSEKLPNNIEKGALILIEDIIREEAPKTLEYFRKEGVALKIISGDNPVTVAAVSERTGVLGAKNYVDARTLPETKEELEKVVEDNTVFGRVTPHQKRELVKALQSRGHTVAMTGDGVNDVLALKESDCGIAMASGSDATKAVAQLVLLDSNFSALPEIVSEGRKMINNIEKVSELYLTKAMNFIILSTIFAIALLPYPIMPIQLTLIGSISIGIPSFFLALGPNKDRVEKGFLKRILQVSIPNGVVIALSTVTIFILAYTVGLSLEECRTLSVIVAGGIGLVVLARVAYPLSIRKLALVLSMIGVFIISFIIPSARKIFIFTPVSGVFIFVALFLVALSWPLITLITGTVKKIGEKRY
ncbi:MAG TPA: carbonate dehydratase [Clostridium sp.]|nr:carbonate dehydratase [Clostridium sp.]